MTALQRVRRFLEERDVSLEVLNYHAGGFGGARYLDLVAERLDPDSSDEEIERRLEAFPPRQRDIHTMTQYARALGYGSSYEYSKATEERLEREKREAAAQREKWRTERVTLAFLSDLERELVELLLWVDHHPVLPEHADGNDAARSLCGRQLALLASWHAADKPKDLRKWFVRQAWPAFVALPKKCLPPDERLEGLFRRYTHSPRTLA